jgi:Rps23 Pro-64 3,4-dihydroxylase Tpa1-like proline 4-hydroxylase
MNREAIVTHALASLARRKVELMAAWNAPVQTSTRHFVIDDFLPGEIAEKAYEGFPKTGDGFMNRESFREKKRTSAQLSAYDPLLGQITYALQDKRVVGAVGEITGIEGLEPDPKLYAGGLSMMFRGDFLNPHVDNSHDSERSRYRRINALYYVSPDWSFERGGNFELWDEERKLPKTLVSMRNRLVVMETNKTSWHSVSRVECDTPRCCISNYYFSKESPDRSEYFHVTSFTGRPEEKVKRAISGIDNSLRNTVSRVLKRGRGLGEINKDGEKS